MPFGRRSAGQLEGGRDVHHQPAAQPFGGLDQAVEGGRRAGLEVGQHRHHEARPEGLDQPAGQIGTADPLEHARAAAFGSGAGRAGGSGHGLGQAPGDLRVDHRQCGAVEVEQVCHHRLPGRRDQQPPGAVAFRGDAEVAPEVLGQVPPEPLRARGRAVGEGPALGQVVGELGQEHRLLLRLGLVRVVQVEGAPGVAEPRGRGPVKDPAGRLGEAHPALEDGQGVADLAAGPQVGLGRGRRHRIVGLLAEVELEAVGRRLLDLHQRQDVGIAGLPDGRRPELADLDPPALEQPSQHAAARAAAEVEDHPAGRA